MTPSRGAWARASVPRPPSDGSRRHLRHLRHRVLLPPAASMCIQHRVNRVNRVPRDTHAMIRAIMARSPREPVSFQDSGRRAHARPQLSLSLSLTLSLSLSLSLRSLGHSRSLSVSRRTHTRASSPAPHWAYLKAGGSVLIFSAPACAWALRDSKLLFQPLEQQNTGKLHVTMFLMFLLPVVRDNPLVLLLPRFTRGHVALPGSAT